MKQAEHFGINFKRQGEWFFIPTGKDDADMASDQTISKTAFRKLVKQDSLPYRNRDSNRHICLLHQNGKLYARGTVYHKVPENEIRHRGDVMSGEHSSLNLADEWHEVYQNTEKASWSMGGSFD